MNERNLVELASSWSTKKSISIMAVDVSVVTKGGECELFTIQNLLTVTDPWVVEWKYQSTQGFAYFNTVDEMMDFFNDVRKGECEIRINEDCDIYRTWKLTGESR